MEYFPVYESDGDKSDTIDLEDSDSLSLSSGDTIVEHSSPHSPPKISLPLKFKSVEVPDKPDELETEIINAVLCNQSFTSLLYTLHSHFNKYGPYSKADKQKIQHRMIQNIKSVDKNKFKQQIEIINNFFK